jgi:D-alanyl-D-alanine carboxypeptidase
VFLLLAITPATPAQSSTLAQRIQTVMDRPEFRHALFGIEFYSLDKAKPIYTLNADKLFTPGSTTKLLTEGTALALLGADYRFHTRSGEHLAFAIYVNNVSVPVTADAVKQIAGQALGEIAAAAY